ncbi:MAG: tRNA (adenosine(37)-N6)-threonylcarbamoyltransferase complex transferase subunit TsaD [Chloroflexota bacterium]|nr:tRNA (adenosine(37)-N6)-threonylcarbamoyltransferase complex transferase subunit TsaD [Chloroflexota bacterium]
MNVLGLETSCDETGAAVVSDGTLVLANVVASQIEIHRRFGGVVPEIASRQHVLTILPTIEEALAQARLGWEDIDAVAVARGPGLVGALLVGVNAAKGVAWSRGIPLLGVNHIEAHIYANWLVSPGEPAQEPAFPLLCLVVSGGHTELVLMRDHGRYERLGRTLDDAAGEAFDKAARILGLPYPGGPAIQTASAAADGREVVLPRAELRATYDFSFSGLKTAVQRVVRGSEDVDVPAVARGFQESVTDILVRKTVAAAETYGAAQVLVAGGVAANARLRERMGQALGDRVRFPRLEYCTDNAAMIAGVGYQQLRRGEASGLDMDVDPGLDLAA